jgi:hypothetical protein
MLFAPSCQSVTPALPFHNLLIHNHRGEAELPRTTNIFDGFAHCCFLVLKFLINVVAVCG